MSKRRPRIRPPRKGLVRGRVLFSPGVGSDTVTGSTD